MKKFILFLYLILVVGTCLAQTIIPGGVVSGNWAQANSPYLIQGAIMIANGTSLNIEPGVHVEFQGSYKFLVLDQLLAIGTFTDTIVFTAADTTVGWLGIRFDHTSSSNDSSKFIYCKVQYGKATGGFPSTDNKGGAFYFHSFSKAIISNSRITDCLAYSQGGGIYCNNSSPAISNNIISGNSASIVGIGGSGGGGIYSDSSNQVISNNRVYNNSTFSNSQSNSRGGGIACVNGSQTIVNNTISNNYSFNAGGGIFCGEGSPTIINDSIINNSTSSEGGGIGSYTSDVNIFNNFIFGNTALGRGGGIYCESHTLNISGNLISYNSTSVDGGGIVFFNNCSGSISNNIISNNSAAHDGGGIEFFNNSTGNISNNAIINNTASNNGGGFFCNNGSSPTITNNTISNNASQEGGALFCQVSSNPALHNTIMWGNTSIAQGNQVYLFDDSSDPDFYYCDVQGGNAAFGLNSNVFYLGLYANNLNLDPQFVSPSGGSGTGFNGIASDWSLQATSPCINSGDSIGTYPAIDIAGNPRVVDSIIDIGAYEYQIPTEVEEISNSISIYPNPVIDNITLHVENNFLSEKLSVEIYNLLGEKLYQHNLSAPQQTINCQLLSKGIYFILVKNEKNNLAVKKMVKM